jgi:phosphate acetyltransferase
MVTSSSAQQGSAKPHAKYDRLIARAKGVEAAKTLVVHPCDETSLRGALEAAELGIIIPILVGPAAKIAAVARAHKLNLDGIEIIDVPHSEAAATKAVELVKAGMGELLMKGSLHTDELMRAVTSSLEISWLTRRLRHRSSSDGRVATRAALSGDVAASVARRRRSSVADW